MASFTWLLYLALPDEPRKGARRVVQRPLETVVGQ